MWHFQVRHPLRCSLVATEGHNCISCPKLADDVDAGFACEASVGNKGFAVCVKLGGGDNACGAARERTCGRIFIVEFQYLKVQACLRQQYKHSL